VLTLRRWSNRAALTLVPLVLTFMIATVYGRYHYAVDVLAGVGVAALGYASAIPLWNRHERGVLAIERRFVEQHLDGPAAGQYAETEEQRQGVRLS
jgi:membrane-associated phospholipid phosphatase